MKHLLAIPFILALSSSPALAGDAGVAAPASISDIATTPLDAGVAVATEMVTPPSEALAPPDIEGDPVGALEEFVAAIKDGHWKLVAALVLALLMLILTKTRDKVKWFKGDRGGAILVMVLGLAGGFAVALKADGAVIDWKVALGIIGTVWMSVGGIQWFKRIIWPKDQTD